MNVSRWFIFVAISRLVFARNFDITILELQNSICFPAFLGNIMLFDSDSLYIYIFIRIWKKCSQVNASEDIKGVSSILTAVKVFFTFPFETHSCT